MADVKFKSLLLSEEKKTQLLTMLAGATIVGLGTVLWYMLIHLQAEGESTSREVRALMVSAAKIEKHIESHDMQSSIWIDKILRNEQKIIEIKTNAAARKDPFTGEEGRVLERRVRAVEKCCDALHLNK